MSSTISKQFARGLIGNPTRRSTPRGQRARLGGSAIAPHAPMQTQSQKYGEDQTATQALAHALGWFSIALGAAELFAPRQVARMVGIPPADEAATALRAYGAREIANGIAILSQPREAKWLWSRVGGDALDLATLGAASGENSTDSRRLAIAAAAVAGVAALDVLAAMRLTRTRDDYNVLGIEEGNEQAITINSPLESVENGWIEWCESGHGRLKNDYAIRFEPAPGARGTEVHLSGGASAGTIREELRRFKQRIETGEIPMSDGPGLSRPAQPRNAAQPSFAEVRS